jgi:alanine racemase
MTLSRRSFLSAAAGAGLVSSSVDELAGRVAGARPGTLQSVPSDRFDPWVEVDAEALAHNVGQVGRLAGGRPILAVVKNNAYGLDLRTAARLLEPMDAIAGFAVVKAEAALALREAGVRKPVLHMGMATPGEGAELARLGVEASLYTDDAERRVEGMARAADRPVDAHLYLDTGLGRMGMPYHRALPWMASLARHPGVRIRGLYMAFTEEPDFDREQLRRFRALVADARVRGIEVGRLHAASSSAVFELPEAHLDMVRPGIALYGSYPNDGESQARRAPLRCAFRLRARVVRVERLRPGDSVSYGRDYVAARPTWTATLPVGHVDGVPRRAVEGARVLLGERTYPVIGAVSASHTIVELGEDDGPPARVGDVATLLGPDHPDIEPWRVAAAIGVSAYDLLMHLNPALPRVVV